MRRDHLRVPAVALLFVLAFEGPSNSSDARAATPIPAQERGRREFNGPGPGGYSQQAQQQGQSAPGQQQGAPAAEASKPAGVDLDAVPVDTSPLARYVPSGTFGLLVEFPGLNAAPDAWKGSAAHGMLNQTSLGEMLRTLLAQSVEAAPDAPARTMTGSEVADVAEHLARHGFALSRSNDPGGFTLVVLRKAAHREVRGLFGKLIGTLAAPETKSEIVERAGGRRVVSMDKPIAFDQQSGPWSWWIEGDDLVFILGADGDGKAADAVIAAIDGQGASALDDPDRETLLALEGGFQPLAYGIYRPLPGGGTPADFRWGFEGEQSVTVARIEAPAPRSGNLAFFDQPPMPLGELPPIPDDVDRVALFSIEPAASIDQFGALIDQIKAGMGTRFIRSADEAIQSRAHIDLKDDVLALLGPKVAYYTLPKPARASGDGPIAAIGDALRGLDLDQFVVAIELKDGSDFATTLDGLVLAINDRVKTAFEASMPPPPPPADGERDRDDPEPPEPPKFSMTVPEPRTYMMRLPPGLYGLTGYQPTITVGRSYLFVATNPIAARQARELESQADAPRWTLDNEVAARLPENPMMLAVDDPSRSLPESIAGLPDAVADVVSRRPAPAATGRAGGSPDRGPQGAVVGAGRSGGDPGPGASGYGSGPGGPGYGASGPGGPGYGPAGPGSSGYGQSGAGAGAPGTPPALGEIRITPDLIPTTDALRQFLLPAVYSVSADDSGVRFEARETLPMQWVLGGSGFDVLTRALPMLRGDAP